MRRKIATDPRDKTYAALGLSESYGQNDHSRVYDRCALIIDYDASTQNAYSSLVKSLVASTKRLNVLLACGGRSSEVQRSWKPDWSCSDGTRGFMGGFTDRRQSPAKRASTHRGQKMPLLHLPTIFRQ
jgi:hypothetical protein